MAARVTAPAREGSRVQTSGGDPLTEEQILALAAEAEAGYELQQALPQGVGRPSLDDGISTRVSFRASRALYEAARRRAAREGRSLSDLAREAMERYIASWAWTLAEMQSQVSLTSE